MATYFWADTHFNHKGIVGYCNRPYKDVMEMNKDLVERWNQTVKRETDQVFLLGDFAFNPGEGEADLLHLFHALRGAKALIIGNHDERNPKVLRLPWFRQEKLFTFKEEGRRAELCHYPLDSWKRGHVDALMLHGHCHGTLETERPRRFDVGADVEPVPVEWKELLARCA